MDTVFRKDRATNDSEGSVRRPLEASDALTDIPSVPDPESRGRDGTRKHQGLFSPTGCQPELSTEEVMLSDFGCFLETRPC